MKKFVIKTAAYLLVLCILTVLFNGLYLLAIDGNLGDTKKYSSMPDDITICNFGSSHSMAGFNYENAGDTSCFNFGLSYEYPSYNYRQLQCYADRISDGATVYITLSFFSLFGEPETQSPDFASRNRKYYRILDNEYIKEFDAKTAFFMRYCPAIISYEETWNSIRQHSQAQRSDQVSSPEAAAGEYTFTRARQHTCDMLDENGSRVYNLGEIEALYDMIEFCHDRDMTVILVTTPFLSEYISAVNTVDPQFFGDYYALIDEIAATAGVQYVDYSQDERFAHDYSLFFDIDHLNSAGAVKFTDIILSETLTGA